MIGAIIGDIVGSRFEFNNTLTTDFELFGPGCNYTDDTIMTVAVADAIMNNRPFSQTLREYGNRYPFPTGGYGANFARWLTSPIPYPYNSCGNGSAMRVSPCALLAQGNREWALTKAAASAICTHNHPEGVKGAMAVTDAILLAFQFKDKDYIQEQLESVYGYNLATRCDDLRGAIPFNELCEITVPQAIIAFLDSDSFENAVRLAVSLGGDSDTIAAITGGIAEAYYGVPEELQQKALNMLPKEFRIVINKMYKLWRETN